MYELYRQHQEHFSDKLLEFSSSIKKVHVTGVPQCSYVLGSYRNFCSISRLERKMHSLS